MRNETYTKRELAEQIRAMGIKPTDTVVIHTSMKAIVDAMGCRKLLTTIFNRAKEDIFAQHIEIPQELYQ